MRRHRLLPLCLQATPANLYQGHGRLSTPNFLHIFHSGHRLGTVLGRRILSPRSGVHSHVYSADLHRYQTLLKRAAPGPSRDTYISQGDEDTESRDRRRCIRMRPENGNGKCKLVTAYMRIAYLLSPYPDPSSSHSGFRFTLWRWRPNRRPVSRSRLLRMDTKLQSPPLVGQQSGGEISPVNIEGRLGGREAG